MEVAEYCAGQQVYCQRDTGSRFYIIKEGSVTCTKSADPAKAPALLTLNAGQYFGERALIKDEIRRVAMLVFPLFNACMHMVQALHAWNLVPC